MAMAAVTAEDMAAVTANQNKACPVFRAGFVFL
ncbi:hypothetical protein JOC77_000487 [Peribacillus deserti]|uniref:Uncharacterized protein n=1 Tax=Peribacillus deserti TaxID=673318 RepID=A0ABS2QD44_9BACI|nr:hypothetical protein [Peribacillus deserti]